MHKLFTSCIRQCLVSRDSISQRYLPRYIYLVSNSVCFSSICRSPGSISTAANYWFYILIRNIGHRTLPKIWVGMSPVRSVQARAKTELILTVISSSAIAEKPAPSAASRQTANF